MADSQGSLTGHILKPISPSFVDYVDGFAILKPPSNSLAAATEFEFWNAFLLDVDLKYIW